MYDVNHTSYEELRRRDELLDRADKLLPSFTEGTARYDEVVSLMHGVWEGDSYSIDELERLLRKLLSMI